MKRAMKRTSGVLRAASETRRVLRAFGTLALVSSLFAACAADEKRAGLVVALQTDMSIPKDVDAVEIEISVFGKVVHSRKYDVGKDGVHIPATLTLLPPDDASSPVTIRVISYQGDTPRTLRRVVTTVPSEREALLRMPIEWLCWNEVEQEGDALVSTCGDSSSCVAGSCAPDEVDSAALPDFAGISVFGGATADGKGACFDTTPCFDRRLTVSDGALDLAKCTLEASELSGNIGLGGASIAVDTEKLNFGITASNGRGICDDDADCIVPLDFDDVTGWSIEGTTVHFASGVCEHIQEKDGADTLVASTLCATKAPSTPACGEWTGLEGTKITVDLGDLPPEPTATGGTGGGTGGTGGTSPSGGAPSGGTGGTGTVTDDPNRCGSVTSITGTTPYDTTASLYNRTSYLGTSACMLVNLMGLEQTFGYVVPPQTGIEVSGSGANDVVLLSLSCSDIDSGCHIGNDDGPVRYFNDSASAQTVYLTVDDVESGAHLGTLTVDQVNPVCGDSILTPYDNYTEPCDDGNKLNGDGCSSTCKLESGYACRTPGQLCYQIACGDGKVDYPETCDDGNAGEFDGCNFSDCHITNTYFCEGEPSACVQLGPGDVASSAVYLESKLNETLEGMVGFGGPSDSSLPPDMYFYGNISAGQLYKVHINATFSGQMWIYQKAACPEHGCDPNYGVWDQRTFSADTPVEMSFGGNDYAPQFVIRVVADALGAKDFTIHAIEQSCGDGYIDEDFFEECDDGIGGDGDGCSALCKIEPGYECAGEPSLCGLP